MVTQISQLNTCTPEPPNKQIILEMLRASVACGDPDLLELLETNSEIIYSLNRGCHEEIDYLKAQLAMIDIALIFSRNKVDESRTRSRSEGFDQFRSVFESEAKAQRTSENRSCGFGNATSFQTFQRDSVNRSRSQSDMESNSSGETQTTRWDRSTQSASGYSNIYDYANSSSEGDGFGSHVDSQINSGKSYSKTAPDFGPNVNDLRTGFPTVILPTPVDIFHWINREFAWDVLGNLFEGGKSIFEGSGSNMPHSNSWGVDDNIDVGYVQQLVEDVPDEPFLSCCCNIDGNPITDCPPYIPYDCNYDAYEPYPSYGRGYNVKYNLSIGIPWIGVLRVDWGLGKQFRQSHTTTQGCTRAGGEGSTSNRYDQIDGSKSVGATDTKDEAQTTRDIHTIGDSRRDARADTTAGSASTGDAHSESHTGSNRDSHSERRGSNQGTSWSKGRGRGEGTSTSDSQSTTEVRHWSQISKALSDMYMRIFTQVREYNKIRALSVGVSVGVIEVCQYSLPVDPVCAGNLRRRALTKVY